MGIKVNESQNVVWNEINNSFYIKFEHNKVKKLNNNS